MENKDVELYDCWHSFSKEVSYPSSAIYPQTTHIALRQKQGNVNSCKGNWLSHTVSLPDSSVPCQSLALGQI